jgi:pyruvate/2-oxoglutarate dehydrogenase complex dihydrolipoamide dehydrogenase (E3) component
VTDPVDHPPRAAAAAIEFDVIVIGAGPAGENIAGPVTAAGLSCAVVESGLAGGECSYFACIPSKALLRPLQVLGAAAAQAGLSTPTLDVAAVLAARDDAVNHLDDTSQVDWIVRRPAALLRGWGRLAGERRVDVETPDGTIRLVANQAVVVATGSDPARPPVPGLDEVPVWTNREALVATGIPERLLVLGGGVVAVELSQAMAGLGAAVTLVVRGASVLERMEPFVGAAVLEQFARDDIDVRLGAELRSVAPTEGGGLRAVLGDGTELAADRLLVATGRTPRTAGLGLEPYGVEPGRTVAVDEFLGVRGAGDSWLYAVGDVNGRSPVTHMGKYQARVCAQVIIARARGQEPPAGGAFADDLGLPQVVFSSPQCGSVGLTEQDARSRGRRVRTVQVGFDQVAASSLQGWHGEGTAQLVIDEERDIVIGATFVGAEIADLVHSATIAVVGEVDMARLWHAVPPFPTISEIWLRLLEADAR